MDEYRLGVPDQTMVLPSDDPEMDATIGVEEAKLRSAGSSAPGTAPSMSGVTAPPNAGNVLNVGESFGDRYRIDKLLGFGGMGAVYKAWDQEVDIPVALKVIRPEMAKDPAIAEQLDR